MNAQRGNVVWLMLAVLMLLATQLLWGMNQLYISRLSGVHTEIQYLRMTLQALSALDESASLAWSPHTEWQCQQARGGGRACVKMMPGDNLLIVGVDAQERLRFWRRGAYSNGKVHFHPRGWSDFCPYTPEDECELPSIQGKGDLAWRER